jgi:hypothetical protein
MICREINAFSGSNITFCFVLYTLVTYLLTLARRSVEGYGCTNLFGKHGLMTYD